MNFYSYEKAAQFSSLIPVAAKLLVGLVLMSSLVVQAEEVRELKLTPTAWAKSVGGLTKLKAMGVPTRIAIIKRNPKNYEAVNFDYESIQQSFLDFSRFEQNQLTFEINKSQGKSKCGADLRAAALCLNADLLLDVTRDPWALVSYDQSKNKSKTLIKDKAGEIGRYAEWVAKKLNYDGVLLARDGNYFLALTSPNVLPGETQVLMLANSSNKILLSVGAQRGAGLMVVKKVEGRLAILEQIVAGEKGQPEFRLGEKIIVEKVQPLEAAPEKPVDKNPVDKNLIDKNQTKDGASAPPPSTEN